MSDTLVTEPDAKPDRKGLIRTVKTRLSGELSDLPLYAVILATGTVLGLAISSLRLGSAALFLDRFGGDAAAWLLAGGYTGMLLFGIVFLVQSRTVKTEQLVFKTTAILFVALLISGALAVVIDLSFTDYLLAVTARVASSVLLFNFLMFLTIVLDARENKRTTGTIGTVILLFSAIGSFGAPEVAQSAGIEWVLIVGIVATSICVALFGVIANRWQSRFSRPKKKNLQQKKSRGAIFNTYLADRYVRLQIVVFAFIGISISLIEFLFLDSVTVFFDASADQATFLGYFLGVTTIATMISSAFLVPVLVNRFDVCSGLSLNPAGALVILLPAAVISAFTLAPDILGMAAIAAMFSFRVFGDSVSRPFQRALAMPLEPGLRMKLQAIQRNILIPAFSIVGSLLAAGLVQLADDHRSATSLVFCIVLIGWILVLRSLSKEYSRALQAALQRRKEASDETEVYSTDTRTLFLEQLREGSANDILYCLKTLPAHELVKEHGLLFNLFANGDPRVRLRVLELAEREKIRELADAVARVAETDADPHVRAYAFRVLICLAGQDDATEFRPLQPSNDRETRKQVAIALLRYGGIEGIIEAGSFVQALARSKARQERLLAAEITGGSGLEQLHKPLDLLLNDPDPDVMTAAIKAVSATGNKDLAPRIVELLGDRIQHGHARAALVAMDEKALGPLIGAFETGGKPIAETTRIIRSLGALRDPRGLIYLANRLDYANLPVRRTIAAIVAERADSLSSKAQSRAEAALVDELATVAWFSAVRVDLAGASFDLSLLDGALIEEINASRKTLLDLISLLYDHDAVAAIKRGLASKEAASRAIAIEHLFTLLDKRFRKEITAAMEVADPVAMVDSLKKIAPIHHMSMEERLAEIISYPQGLLSPWTKACALIAAGDERCLDVAGEVQNAVGAGEPLVRETALWTLSRLSELDGDTRELSRQLSAGAAIDDSIFVNRMALAIQKSGGITPQRRTMSSTTIRWRAPMPLLLEKVLLLCKSPYFADVGETELAQIAEFMDEFDLQSGAIIVRPGDMLDGIYFVADGAVRLVFEDKSSYELKPGAVFGLGYLFAKEPVDYMAMAMERTLVFQLSESDLSDVMADNVEIAKQMIRALGKIAQGADRWTGTKPAAPAREPALKTA